MDFSEIKANTDIVDVVGGYVALKKKGHEHVGLCPFHDDHKGSLQVNDRKQIFKCFACGEGGDAIDFLLAMGKNHKEAVEELSQGTHLQSTPKRNKAQAPKRKVWKQIAPTAPPASFQHYRHGEPSSKWLYRLADGKPYGYVCRFDTPEGKEILPYIFATDGERQEWRWQGFDTPRPLYNLHLIEANSTATILMVEGEKAADAAQAHFSPDKVVVSTWIGGANAIGKADFSPLKGRRAFLSPDNDVQGLSAMLHVRHIAGLGASKIVPLDTTLPKGWDVADKEWQEGELRKFVNDRAVADIPANAGEALWSFKQVGEEVVYEFGMKADSWVFRKATAPEPEPAPEAPYEQEGDYYADAPPPMDDEPRGGNIGPDTWFRFMGYEKNESGTQAFYFYVFRSNQLVRLSPTAMTKSNLLLLAPLNWWEYMFPAQKAKFDTDAASNWLIEMSIQVGIFNQGLVRGRGAWMDGKDVVIHCGSHLIVNGEPRRFNEYKSRHIYEAAIDLGFTMSAPAKKSKANELLELCKMLNWERPISAYFLAGWCVIAPVCGALKWRPHLWITGPAGSGKSWTFKEIISRMLGDTAVGVEGETTAPGIRQYLRADALPVIFDEAEGEDKRAHERIQAVLTLMRATSASTGFKTIKGSAGGGPDIYDVRSCFAFASIGVSLNQQSDRSRVSVLSMYEAKKDADSLARWAGLQKRHAEVVTDDFVASIQSRTVLLLPTILKNARIFQAAAAAALKNQRTGDQIGALLAGAYSLTSDSEISFEDAVKWIESKDWSEERALEATKDEVRLITHLMEKIAVVELNGKRLERTVGELVTIGKSFIPASQAEDITPDTANKRLLTLGYRIDKDAETLLVSNTAEFVKQSLKDTPWQNNHTMILKRLKGAMPKDQTTFGSQLKSRAVEIPLATIFGE